MILLLAPGCGSRLGDVSRIAAIELNGRSYTAVIAKGSPDGSRYFVFFSPDDNCSCRGNSGEQFRMPADNCILQIRAAKDNRVLTEFSSGKEYCQALRWHHTVGWFDDLRLLTVDNYHGAAEAQIAYYALDYATGTSHSVYYWSEPSALEPGKDMGSVRLLGRSFSFRYSGNLLIVFEKDRWGNRTQKARIELSERPEIVPTSEGIVIKAQGKELRYLPGPRKFVESGSVPPAIPLASARDFLFADHFYTGRNLVASPGERKIAAEEFVRGRRLYRNEARLSDAQASFGRAIHFHPRPEYYYELGNISIDLRQYARAQSAYAAAVALNHPEPGKVYYNAACAASLNNEIDAALQLLENAFRSGYNHFAHAGKDSDLAAVRAGSRFPDLIQKYVKLGQLARPAELQEKSVVTADPNGGHSTKLCADGSYVRTHSYPSMDEEVDVDYICVQISRGIWGVDESGALMILPRMQCENGAVRKDECLPVNCRASVAEAVERVATRAELEKLQSGERISRGAGYEQRLYDGVAPCKAAAP